jgi:xylan 1,4-beta-xylosidase
VLNVFRMLGRMHGNRVTVESTGGLPLDSVRDRSVRGRPDISALATRDARSVAVLVWNYHDDDLRAPPAEIDLTIQGLPAVRPTQTHYRIDAELSNSYELWKKMGSPQPPSPTQYAELEKAGQLQLLAPPRTVEVNGGRVVLPFSLPRQGVSLIIVSW